MKKFRCTVCGYVYEGDAAPEKCPLCKAPAALRFKVYSFHIRHEASACRRNITSPLSMRAPRWRPRSRNRGGLYTRSSR